jgi:hypothetical protein
MHIIILRYAPSFVDNDGVVGQHEQVEIEINQRKYKLDSVREGYCIPFASEIKLIDYRIKKECVSDFLRDLAVHNLHSKQNPVTLWKMIQNEYRCGAYGINRKFLFVSFLFNVLYKMGLWLHPFDPSPYRVENNVVVKKFYPEGWCYNFFLGVLPDVETEYGEEL